MIKCVILEDNEIDLKLLQSILNSDDRFIEIASFRNIEDFTNFSKSNKVDLLFADIELGSKVFFDFWEEGSNTTELIIVSAFSKYALTAFEKYALHFISKPIKENHVFIALERAYQKIKLNLKLKELPYFYVQIGNKKFQRIEFDELVSVEANGSYLKLTLTDNRKIVILKRLKSLLEELPKKNFRQIHRSTIININAINIIDVNEVTLNNGQVLQFGNTFKNIVKDLVSKNTLF
jgi:DNA-binding LytR/AlgR family response regulator